MTRGFKMTELENAWQKLNDTLIPEMVQDYEIVIWCKWKRTKSWSKERGWVFNYNQNELAEAKKKIKSFIEDPNFRVSKVELRPRLKSTFLSSY